MPEPGLYRRWRSRTFAEIIGQDHVTHTLLNALRAGRIAHAYLFSGPRGTGKTTTARVLAKAVNCLDPREGEPCNQCAICTSMNESRALDLIEIDAASNRGIDEMRDLRDKIGFSPSECRFKVYVIDEVHMLTNEAFNALLKTLEEPPPHAIFVLATTEPHKIPLTVLSRCQRFDFRRVTLADLQRKLRTIAASENIRIDPAALEAIARYATGSFRDAESLLDQLVSSGAETVTLEDLRRVLGSAPEELLASIIRAVAERDAGAALRLVNEALDQGAEPRQLTRELLEWLRVLILVKNGAADLAAIPAEALPKWQAQADAVSPRYLLDVIRLVSQAGNQLKAGIHGQLPLELALVEAVLTADHEEQLVEPAPRANPSRREFRVPVPDEQSAPPLRTVDATQDSPSTEPTNSVAADSPQPAVQQPEIEGDLSLSWLQVNWGRLLQGVRTRSRPVEALLKSCEPLAVDDDVVVLGFYHAFHKDRVSEEKSRRVVEDALQELRGRHHRIQCRLFEGNATEREQQTESNRRDRLLDNPMVSEALKRYGARIIDVQ